MADGPLLVAVDDVHFADVFSRRWQVTAAGQADRLPLLLVVAERRQYEIEPPRRVWPTRSSPSLSAPTTLAPLSPDAAAEPVRSALGPPYPATAWRTLYGPSRATRRCCKQNSCTWPGARSRPI